MNEPCGFVKMLKCGIDCCKYESKQASHLKQHKANIHDIGVTWHKCDQPECDFKCKQACKIKRHKANIHDIGITWYKCDQPECDFKCKDAGCLKRHKAQIHDIEVKWYKCDQPECDYKCKSAGCLKRHKAQIHDIEVKWYKCDQDGCNFKCKDAGNLKKHKAYIHDIGIIWHKCDQDGCDFKCKQAGHLKIHREFVHDIGTNQCEYCCNNRNSKNSYLCKITGITSNICNGCYNKVTGKNTRKEKEWSDYLDKHLGINGLLSSDKNLRQLGGCQRYRPDKLYTDLNYVELAECDEFEHKRSNGNYECDERRISEIYEEDGIIGKNMAVLRWNPDNYTPKEGLKKLSRKERLKVYVELSKKLREKTSHADKIHIYYLFYSEDNPRLSKNIPYTMIHNLDEISHI